MNLQVASGSKSPSPPRILSHRSTYPNKNQAHHQRHHPQQKPHAEPRQGRDIHTDVEYRNCFFHTWFLYKGFW